MNIAILLSGGSGQRLGGGVPKQYRLVNGKMLLLFSLETLLRSSYIDRVIIVAAKEWQAKIVEAMGEWMTDTANVTFAAPGETRQLSIISAMRQISPTENPDTTVFIHDAARPNLTGEMIVSCYHALKGHDGVLPVLPMKDTVYASENGRTIDRLLNRSTIFAGQAPELFYYAPYRDANEALFPDRIYTVNGSTEPAVLAGLDIVMLSGDEHNYKITTAEDFARFCKEQGAENK